MRKCRAVPICTPTMATDPSNASAQPIAAANSARRELGGHPVCAGVQLAEGHGDDGAGVVEIFQSHAVGASAERGGEELG